MHQHLVDTQQQEHHQALLRQRVHAQPLVNGQHQERDDPHGQGIHAQWRGFQDIQQQSETPGQQDTELGRRPECPVEHNQAQPFRPVLKPAYRKQRTAEHQGKHNAQSKNGITDHRQH